ncbi:MAG TPA: hypothetical protein VKA00_07690, partial [Trueperaceae bacterium]|nr:hypothetical protein [Trueperaceae bacterium]
LPPHLTEWVHEQLNEGRVARPSSTDQNDPPRRAATPARAPAHGKPKERLAQVLVHWLGQLRPDSHMAHRQIDRLQIELVPPMPKTRANVPWMIPEEDLAGYGEWNVPGRDGDHLRAQLFLNQEHWLVEPCLSKGAAVDDLAWLLLACYAHINDVLEPVSNAHERAFQRRLFEALRTGRLGYVAD